MGGLLGGGFKYFSFSPLPEEIIKFDYNTFQMDWNHQLDGDLPNLGCVFRWFFTFYHDKSPSSHHLGEYVLELFPSIWSPKRPEIFAWLEVGDRIRLAEIIRRTWGSKAKKPSNYLLNQRLSLPIPSMYGIFAKHLGGLFLGGVPDGSTTWDGQTSPTLHDGYTLR